MAMAEPTAERPWYDRIGYGLSLGGGVYGFVGDDFRDLTNVGGSWDVRLLRARGQYLALEASYIGSAQSINALGLDNDAVLVGNGLQAALRVNFLRNYYVQPFIFGGAAWRNYSLSDTNINVSDVTDTMTSSSFRLALASRDTSRASWRTSVASIVSRGVTTSFPTLAEVDEGAIVWFAGSLGRDG